MKKEQLELEIILKIVDAIKEDREDYENNNQHARVLGINESVYNQIIKGKVEGKLDKSVWLNVARRLNVNLRNDEAWVTVETPVFIYITQQLEDCQAQSLSKILCDLPNIGKSHTAKVYASRTKNAVYIDCSLCKTKNKLLAKIAQEFGLVKRGKYEDLLDDLCYYINSLDNPLIILDEAGDLKYEAFLELKAIWNATEEHCGWYMMGATGLRAKINKAIENEKQGYEEIFSRFNDDYGFVTPRESEERQRYMSVNVTAVIKANAPKDADIKKLIIESRGSLRKAKNSIKKLRLGAA